MALRSLQTSATATATAGQSIGQHAAQHTWCHGGTDAQVGSADSLHASTGAKLAWERGLVQRLLLVQAANPLKQPTAQLDLDTVQHVCRTVSRVYNLLTCMHPQPLVQPPSAAGRNASATLPGTAHCHMLPWLRLWLPAAPCHCC